jgi:hypothetical protein
MSFNPFNTAPCALVMAPGARRYVVALPREQAGNAARRHFPNRIDLSIWGSTGQAIMSFCNYFWAFGLTCP